MDMHLIVQVQMVTTGADVHKISGLIKMYQSAAQGTSRQSRNACAHFELALRKYLEKHRQQRLQLSC
jgi:hypothetical protein